MRIRWHRHVWRRYRTMPDREPDYVIDQYICAQPWCTRHKEKRRRLNRGL